MSLSSNQRQEHVDSKQSSTTAGSQGLEFATDDFQVTVDVVPVAILVVDDRGTIVLTNRAADALFCYAASELVGQQVEILVPLDLRQGHKDLRQSYELNKSKRAMGAGRDLRGVRKDGQEFPLEIGLSPLESRGRSYTIASVVDISERQQNTVTLERMLRELTERNMELQNFAFIASHDLKTPLRAITCFSQFLRQDFENLLDARGKDYLQRIIESGKRLQEMIDHLIDYVRLDEASRPLRPVRLRESCEAAVAILEPMIWESGTDIQMGELPEVMGDVSQLAHVFQNLISNAIKYRRDATPQIDIQPCDDEHELIVRVSDNGCGIESRHHGKIFDIFQRLHSHDTIPGSGMGLSISRHIMQRHGGRIWLESQPGTGTTFFLAFPRTTSEQRSWTQ